MDGIVKTFMLGGGKRLALFRRSIVPANPRAQADHETPLHFPCQAVMEGLGIQGAQDVRNLQPADALKSTAQ
jgi:hypothetical protein